MGLKFKRYGIFDHQTEYVNDDESAPRVVIISRRTMNTLGDPEEISIMDAKNDIPDSWMSVYKGVGGGRWQESAVLENLQTAQALLNTMSCGKIVHDGVQIEIKNSHLNDA